MKKLITFFGLFVCGLILMAFVLALAPLAAAVGIIYMLIPYPLELIINRNRPKPAKKKNSFIGKAFSVSNLGNFIKIPGRIQ